MDQPQAKTAQAAPRPALIVEQDRKRCAQVMMHNFTWTSCCVVGKEIRDFSDAVALHFDGLQQLLKGRIIWREGQWAGIAFERAEMKHDERRAETRFEFVSPVIVSDASLECRIPGTTRNASRSGCLIEANDVDQLTRDIFVKIPAFEWPVKGQIRWRHFNMAGVRLLWTPDRDRGGQKLVKPSIRSVLDAAGKPAKPATPAPPKRNNGSGR